MKKTWYFGALLILFTLLGFNQNYISEPNQEIVLKFSDVDITSDEAQSTIAHVKEQLLSIGVETVQVKELNEGQLKITYYSGEDIESIKKLLSADNRVEFSEPQKGNKNTSNFPSKDHEKEYKLDVFKIHKNSDSESGLGGKSVLSLKQDFDRFHNPKPYIFKNEVGTNDVNTTVKEAFKVRRNIAIAIENTSRNIPEVRAGPTAFGKTYFII